MAKIITDVGDAIEYLNSLLELDSDPPGSGEEDFTVWLSLLNVGVNLWENEEGILWRELYTKLADASTGDKTTTTATSYDVPDDFVFPNSAYVWLGTGTNKTAYKVIKQEDVQLYENNTERWCYFLMDPTPSLEFNPNLTIESGQTISYNYYKSATKLTTENSTFEMSDPMFAVYYALSELTKEEGNSGSLTIATQKLEGMKTKNNLTAEFQSNTAFNITEDGFGI